MDDRAFQAAKQHGRTGERRVADWLQRAGWYIIPSYDYTGSEGQKAPRIEGLASKHILPDLDAARRGIRQWVEVKTKTRATFTYTTQRFEHGIPQRHWEEYQQVQAITGCPVHLAIYEEETAVILLQRLDVLIPHARRSTMKKAGRDEGAMVYFPRDQFQVYRLDDSPHPA